MHSRAVAAVIAPLATAGLSFLVAPVAQATSDNWGNPPNVCTDGSQNLYDVGYCTPAVSPQQTVKGTTSLQYFVSCQDALANPNYADIGVGPYYPFWQSYAAAVNSPPGSFGEMVAWTTGSSVVSGEVVTADPVSGTMNADGSVQAYGSTPVKVYNAEVFTESTTVTFAAACIQTGPNVDSSFVGAATADTADQRIAQWRATASESMARSLKDFASGKRKREEYRVVAEVGTGVEVHDRINLTSGTTKRTRLTCPRGLVPSGAPQTSYGFDALKDVSDYEPSVTVRRSWAKRGVTLAYSARTLKYPTVAYTVLACGKR